MCHRVATSSPEYLLKWPFRSLPGDSLRKEEISMARFIEEFGNLSLEENMLKLFKL